MGAQRRWEKKHREEYRLYLESATSKSWFHCSHPPWGAIVKAQETLKEHHWKEKSCGGFELVTKVFQSCILEFPNNLIKRGCFHFSWCLSCFICRMLSFTFTAQEEEKKILFKKSVLNSRWYVRTVLLYVSSSALYWMELISARYCMSAYRQGCFLCSSGKKQDEGTTWIYINVHIFMQHKKMGKYSRTILAL